MTSRYASLVLPPGAASVRTARAFVDHQLAGWGVDGDSLDRARLLTSELVTNAVRYGGPPLSVGVSVRRDGVRIEVRDGTSALPRLGPAEPDRPNGRGMLLVAGLADRWGAEVRGSGKVVWCELAVPTHLHS